MTSRFTTKNSGPTALLLIDVQQGFNHPTNWGPSRSNPSVHDNVQKLLSSFRSVPLPPKSQPLVIHIQHLSRFPDSPLHASNPSSAFEVYAKPHEDEVIFTKNVNSAFIGTNLENYLRSNDVSRLVVCGLTTDHCVSTTVRMAANLGVVGADGEVLLVGDATAAHAKGGFDAETIHAVQLASLDGEFCRVVKTEEVLREMETW